jgi:multiple sugar transport system ATP-binding protein
LKTVSLNVRDQEFTVLLGPSGCGKTTLLRIIAGLETETSGDISIGNRQVNGLPPRARQLAMVFQNYAVFPHMTVFENIAFGLRMQKKADEANLKRKVEWAAELMHIESQLPKFTGQLSGGQRQRVAVARALAVEPQVLLMDEPLSNLDALLRLNFRAELKRLVGELKTTTIYVTHDQVEALSLGDRIAVMRAGGLVQVGTPMEIYDRPRTEFVGSFIGNPPMNFLNGTVRQENGSIEVAIGDNIMSGPAALTGRDGHEVLVGIRAENIVAETYESPDGIGAKIEVVEPLGSHLLLTALVGGQRLKVMARADAEVRPGDTMWLTPEMDKLRWFDKTTGDEIASV